MAAKRAKVRGRDAHGPVTSAGRPTPDADLTWLLARATQTMRAATSAQAEAHGLQLRDYIILTALGTLERSTQLALGAAIGVDKTTMMLDLDRLEERGLVVRKADPRDRRTRIPEATAAGRALQAQVAASLVRAEAEVLDGFSRSERRALRLMLCQLIGEGDADRGGGSCV